MEVIDRPWVGGMKVLESSTCERDVQVCKIEELEFKDLEL